jgi:7-cyano-7-deazaguanine synthase in queuosine biosynthesis
MSFWKKTSYRPRIIALDYDGTISKAPIPTDTTDSDPTYAACEFIDLMQSTGHLVVLNTARPNEHLDQVVKKLPDGVKIPYFQSKPPADIYLDDRGFFPGFALAEAFIEQQENDSALEYYQKMAGGELASPFARNIRNDQANPDFEPPQHDPYFRVAIPLTGGMDSVTLLKQAVESGVPILPIYCLMGQEYAELEIETVNKFLEHYQVPTPLHIIDLLALDFKRFSYIMTGRNAIIVLAIAEYMEQNNLWGEAWFGNYAGESPVYGGDKSRRFWNDMQRLLAYHNFDLVIQHPLIGMDKEDEVAYWLSKGEDEFNFFTDNVKSCFHPTHQACGECQPCAKRWFAYKANGIDIRDKFANPDIKVGLKPHIDKYRKVLKEAAEKKDFSHYPPQRINSTLSAIRDLDVEALHPEILEEQK